MSSQANVGNGVRMSSAEAFLRPVMHQENLHIATFAHVTKVSTYVYKFMYLVVMAAAFSCHIHANLILF